jgi:hypothetical protein
MCPQGQNAGRKQKIQKQFWNNKIETTFSGAKINERSRNIKSKLLKIVRKIQNSFSDG